MLKIVLILVVIIVGLWVILRWLKPGDPLDAASSALRNRMFNTIKKPWED